MDDVTKRRVCELIAGIIATDAEFHPAELEFMTRAFAAFGIAGGEEDQAICPTITSMEAAKQMATLPADHREEAMALLMQGAVADGKVTPEEREWLLAVGRAAGISRDDVDDQIATALLAADPAF
jgi:phage I-like protein